MTNRKPIPLDDMPPEARRILEVANAHIDATGHNHFRPQFDAPAGPALECAVCGVFLPLLGEGEC